MLRHPNQLFFSNINPPGMGGIVYLKILIILKNINILKNLLKKN